MHLKDPLQWENNYLLWATQARMCLKIFKQEHLYFFKLVLKIFNSNLMCIGIVFTVTNLQLFWEKKMKFKHSLELILDLPITPIKINIGISAPVYSRFWNERTIIILSCDAKPVFLINFWIAMKKKKYNNVAALSHLIKIYNFLFLLFYNLYIFLLIFSYNFYFINIELFYEIFWAYLKIAKVEQSRKRQTPWHMVNVALNHVQCEKGHHACEKLENIVYVINALFMPSHV